MLERFPIKATYEYGKQYTSKIKLSKYLSTLLPLPIIQVQVARQVLLETALAEEYLDYLGYFDYLKTIEHLIKPVAYS